MPRGPRDEKRPADAIGTAITVAKIATGVIAETTETDDGKIMAAVELGRKGGKARAQKMPPESARGRENSLPYRATSLFFWEV